MLEGEGEHQSAQIGVIVVGRAGGETLKPWTRSGIVKLLFSKEVLERAN